MAPTILRGSDYFFTNIYEGNGGGQRVGRFVPFTDNGTIAKSCKFNDADSSQLSKTPSGAGNRRTFTFSVWLKRGTLTGSEQYILSASNSASSTKYDFIYFDTDNCVRIQHHNGSSVEGQLKTNRTFEDTSKWYHLVYRCDTTQTTAGDRMRLYIDGDEITSFSIDTNPSQNYDTDVNDATLQSLGKPGWADGVYFDGYMAEVNLADGQSYGPDTFGITDTSTGRWIPKSLGSITYGTNGYRLTFANSAGQTIGDDTSGNGNDYSVSNLAVENVTTDSPTQNYPTLSPYQAAYAPTMSEGNLRALSSTNLKYSMAASTLSWDTSDTTGYYMEFRKNDSSGLGQNFFNVGCIHNDGMYRELNHTYADNPTDGSLVWYENGNMSIGTAGDGNRVNPGAGTIGVYGNTGDVMMIAAKGDQVYLGNASKGVWYSSQGAGETGNPATGVGGFTLEKKGRWHFMMPLGYNSAGGKRADGTANFGQNPTFSGSITAVANTDGSGSLFKYTPPTGFKALMQDNLPETGKGIPDFTWIKDRDNTLNHNSYDSSNGVFNRLVPNNNSAILNTQGGISKFLKGGIVVGDTANINNSGASMVSWNWVANGGTTSANTDGSGATIASTIQANQTAGFSIVRYDGDGGNAARKVEHGLSQAPEWILLKFLDVTGNWTVYHKSVGNTKRLSLNSLSATDTNSSYFNDTSPTSSVFTVGSSFNQSTAYDYVAYCWHGVAGFSKFDSYSGNGNTNGPFIYTGFKPSWLMIKSSSHATSWYIFDTKRDPINPAGKRIIAEDTYVEDAGTTEAFDFLSNGFKLRNTSNGTNGSGRTYIYMAFAEHPFAGTSSINPITAR
mgnify:CR=1 FL=1